MVSGGRNPDLAGSLLGQLAISSGFSPGDSARLPGEATDVVLELRASSSQEMRSRGHMAAARRLLGLLTAHGFRQESASLRASCLQQ